ncbi:L-fuconolactonase [Rathayibacter oskolensis]|uniref:L-fuconolactonase n=1 Tax=Rathayibacter oskolensis TaxID=1891671 RepID=A0A1X7PC62_9MICO|nr:amidohydrolase family protein [Rathayibacter oskolensis]SMH48853.1 L-fuconolactonase [Rathayibacter oskolensis]
MQNTESDGTPTADTAPVIDAHQHYWRTAAQDQPWRRAHHDAIARDFGPEDLDPLLEAAGIDGTVVMQSVDEPGENDRLAAYAEHPTVVGIVSWLPVREPAAARAELERLDLPKHVGVRCLVADDPLDWLGEDDVRALFRDIAARGLAWDVVPITEAQIRNVTALAEAVPDLRIVVDHLGRPPVDSGGWLPWAGNIARLAGNANVSVKVSVGIDVLSAWAAWDIDAVTPFIRHVAGLFGPDRLMAASNWPVVLLRTDYATAWNDIRAALTAEFADPEDRRAVLGGTASRVYRLERFAPAAAGASR